MDLKDEIRYRPVQIVKKRLVQNELLSMTLFALDKGKELGPHVCGGDAMVIVLEGVGRFLVGEEEFVLQADESLVMPNDLAQAVFAQERLKMLLIVSF